MIFNEIPSVLKDLVVRNVRTKKMGFFKEKKSDVAKRKQKARKLAKERAEFAREKNELKLQKIREKLNILDEEIKQNE